MKPVRYRFHPSEYALGENEKFYGDMEARGWRLVKRGRYLSRFAPVPPGRARYRVEVSMPAFLEEPGLGEGQLSIFEECGWEYVAGRGFLHIFRTDQDSGAPEFYTDPRQQAATLRRVRRDLWWSWGLLALFAALLLLSRTAPGGSPRAWGGEMYLRLVQLPAFVVFCALWPLWLLCRLLADTWQINRTYFRLKRGRPLDHAPKGRQPLHRLFGRGILCLAALCLALTAAQLAGTESYDFPDMPDGPYLTMRDLGHEGERVPFMGRESGVTHTRSLLADYWDTVEIIEDGENTIWIYQDVYRLRDPEMSMDLAKALMDSSAFTRSAEDFVPLAVEGLDGAWTGSRLEAVAVRGELVAYITYHGGYEETGLSPVLTALAERWTASGTRPSFYS